MEPGRPRHVPGRVPLAVDVPCRVGVAEHQELTACHILKEGRLCHGLPSVVFGGSHELLLLHGVVVVRVPVHGSITIARGTTAGEDTGGAPGRPPVSARPPEVCTR